MGPFAPLITSTSRPDRTHRQPCRKLRGHPDAAGAAEGHVPLQNAFFASGEIVAHGVDSVLRGASTSARSTSSAGGTAGSRTTTRRAAAIAVTV